MTHITSNPIYLENQHKIRSHEKHIGEIGLNEYSERSDSQTIDISSDHHIGAFGKILDNDNIKKSRRKIIVHEQINEENLPPNDITDKVIKLLSTCMIN